MSDDTIITARDATTGRFLAGNTGGGRKPGSRNKLGEAFLEDLRDAWTELGPEALRRCAVEEPSQFCRIVAGLLPRDININQTIGVNVADTLSVFRQAVQALGNAEPRQLPKVINAKD